MISEILMGLVQRGIPLHIAQGIVANMKAESGLNPGINEINPIVEGSRGGYGLNQWTGPRRRQYEAFAAERGVPLDDLQAQLDFTLWELQNTERGAWEKLQGAESATDAARIYSEAFLRPGIPHMENRLAYAAEIAGQPAPQQNAFAGSMAVPMGSFGVAPQQNAFRFKSTQLDPAMFMNNAFARA